jgi:hypothetical protein
MLRVAEPAKEAVRSSLNAKGLSEASNDQADLAVNLRGQSIPRVNVQSYGYSYPAMTRYGMVNVVHNPYTSVSTYTERTLVIEMYDRHSKEMVWTGWLKKEMSGKVQPKHLQEAIQEILQKYPPDTSDTSGSSK